MQNQMLMIQTGDKKYFTDFQNLPMLVEFIKTFNAELALVETDEVAPMDLESLAPALCDDSYRSPRFEHGLRIVQKLYPSETVEGNSRKAMIENAKSIRTHIRTLLESGRTLRISEVKKKFESLNLTDSCLSNHMTVVRNEMAKDGLPVVRLKMGIYKVAS